MCSLTDIKNPIAPCVCCYTTLWNINVSKTVINDKLQGSVATYLRRGGIVNNRIKKGLLMSLRVKFFLNGWIFGKVRSKSVVVSCTCALGQHAAKRRRKCTKQSCGCFADINVSTHARCGGIFDTHLIASLPRNLLVTFLKSVRNWQNYGHESVAPFWPSLYVFGVLIWRGIVCLKCNGQLRDH